MLLNNIKNEIIKKYENLSEYEKLSETEKRIIEEISINTNKKNREEIQENINKSKLKQTITQLKLLYNELENNYVLLLKNISKQIVKPKDLFKKQDVTIFNKKIN